jgi:hypothetical protein
VTVATWFYHMRLRGPVCRDFAQVLIRSAREVTSTIL